jgi:predicted acylesterase/phospholipase RssA
MRGCQVGLVLSSGAARGLSHIGVLQVLEENGIEVDIVAGSSMGAYIGAVWGLATAGVKWKGLLARSKAIEVRADGWQSSRVVAFLTDRARQRLEERSACIFLTWCADSRRGDSPGYAGAGCLFERSVADAVLPVWPSRICVPDARKYLR